MTARLGAGDTVVNLAAAGLALNAWMASGDARFRDWIVQYVGAWREPPPPTMGSYRTMSAPTESWQSARRRWYGGHYGWSWPHGGTA